MRAIEIFAQLHILHLSTYLLLLLLPLLPLPRLLLLHLRTTEIRPRQPLRAGFLDRSSQRILVHPVQEALDDAERDKPSHVDPAHHVRMLQAPALDTYSLSQ